jgi:outer membrane protein assembly factor BamE
MKVTINNQRRPLRRTRSRAVALAALGALAVSACVYRMPIQQGNFLDPAVIAQVQPGMTQTQVRYLLGTPLVPQSFDNSRWDYQYYLKERRLQQPRRGHVTVHFKNDLVERVETDVKDSSQVPLSTRPVAAPNT